MSESKHTPGPWEVTSVSMNTGNVSVGHKASRIVIADVTNAASFGDMIFGAMKRGGGGFEQDDCHTQFANARLIAAAPELLEALKETLPFMVEIAKARHHKFELHMADDDSTIGKAMRAIAKAEGRS